MVLSLVPLLASESSGSDQAISNAAVDVTWARSGDAVNAVEVNNEGNFDLSQVYTHSGQQMLSTWSLLNAITPTISGVDADGNDLVWDGANQSFHYTDDHLNGTYTAYPTATIKGTGTVRFQGTFDLNSILTGAPAGSQITNLKIGVNPYVTGDNQVALNDQMFVFLYPADVQMTDANFMDYYVFGAGFDWVNQWLGPNGEFGTPESFNGVPMIHTFRDFAYYSGGYDEERAAYEAYGYELAGLGYPGWEGSDLGWFGHGTTYLLNQDKANGNLNGWDQLYISDGLFFNNLDSNMTVDLSKYGDNLPTNWVIDIFAVNTDAVGGISQLNVFANYDESTFGSTGSIQLSKEMGDKCSINDSITGGYAGEKGITTAGPGNSGKTTTAPPAHNLDQKLGQNGNNWFEFNTIDPGFGVNDQITFDLVNGNNLDKVGAYTVTNNGNGSFTFTMADALYAVGPNVSISNNITFAKNTNDKAYSASNIWTSAPGQQQFSLGKGAVGDGHSFTIQTTGLDMSKPVYIYMHLSGLTGYKNTNGLGPDATFIVNVQGPSFPDGQDFKVPMNGSLNIPDLKPGTYVIRETTDGYIPTYTVNGETKTGGTIKVTVDSDKTTSVKLNNKPGTNPVSSEIDFKKIVETADGYAAGEGFTFNVYTAVNDDGTPVADSFVTSITTGSDGVGTFIADGYDVGTWFYLFEDMNDSQLSMYAPQSSYFAIQSTEVRYVVNADANPILNSLLPGVFTVEKLIAQDDTVVNGGEGFSFSAYAAIDENGLPVGDAIQTVTTGPDGLAVFGLDGGFKIGGTYYVFENMTDEQKQLYVAEGSYIAVAATAEGAEAGTFEFTNDLAFGSLEVAADIDGTHFVEYYVPGGYLTFTTSGTLVSWVGYGDHLDPLVDGSVFQGFFATVGQGSDTGNGFTFLEINLPKLIGIGGSDIGIAQTDQSGSPYINNQFNLDIQHDYNIKIEGDNLVVSCDVLSGGFGIALSQKAFVGNPNSQTQGHPYNINNPFTIPIADLPVDSDGNFYFFFHIESGSTMYVTPLQVTSWTLDHTGQVYDEYDGDYTVDVCDANGVNVASGSLGLFEDLAAGDYTVTVTAGGNVIGSQGVTVEAGKTVTLDFGSLFVVGPTEEVHTP